MPSSSSSRINVSSLRLCVFDVPTPSSELRELAYWFVSSAIKRPNPPALRSVVAVSTALSKVIRPSRPCGSMLNPEYSLLPVLDGVSQITISTSISPLKLTQK